MELAKRIKAETITVFKSYRVEYTIINEIKSEKTETYNTNENIDIANPY